MLTQERQYSTELDHYKADLRSAQARAAQYEAELHSVRAQASHYGTDLRSVLAQARHQENVLRTMYASRSWWLTKPWRGVGRLLKRYRA